jgi:uncharacterized protein (DUF2062 family)
METSSPAVPAPSFWSRKIAGPILAQLRQGITPEKIALTLAMGFVLGLFPILGATTALCGAAAYCFRLNQALIQLVNYLASPVHLALLLVFYRAGESLFGQEHLPLSIPMLAERFQAGPWQFFCDFGRIGLQAVVVWLLVAPVAVGLLYFLLRPLLRRAARRLQSPL